jgi:cephalosporin-C deacetylase
MDQGIFTSTGSINEAADFVNRYPDTLEKVLETLSYFDNMNLADRINIPVLVSAALKDPICSAEAIFSAYNRITAEKDIKIYPFSGHATPPHFNREMLNFISRKFNI